VKLGSCKLVLASTPESVKEMLVKKSADYAGRPQTYVFNKQTLGMSGVLLKGEFFAYTTVWVASLCWV